MSIQPNYITVPHITIITQLRIREEWEEEQKKIKAAKQEQERLAEEKKQKQVSLFIVKSYYCAKHFKVKFIFPS